VCSGECTRISADLHGLMFSPPMRMNSAIPFNSVVYIALGTRQDSERLALIADSDCDYWHRITAPISINERTCKIGIDHQPVALPRDQHRDVT
jgi:hypothetical protein